MTKTKVLPPPQRAGPHLANQSNMKSFQIALTGWKKAGPPKKATPALIMQTG